MPNQATAAAVTSTTTTNNNNNNVTATTTPVAAQQQQPVAKATVAPPVAPKATVAAAATNNTGSDKSENSDGDETEEENEVVEESPDGGRWLKRNESVAQRDVPAIDQAFLAMDTENGFEVVWNEIHLSGKKQKSQNRLTDQAKVSPLSPCPTLRPVSTTSHSSVCFSLSAQDRSNIPQSDQLEAPEHCQIPRLLGRQEPAKGRQPSTASTLPVNSCFSTFYLFIL